MLRVRDETLMLLQGEAWTSHWWDNGALESFHNMTYNEQHNRALKKRRG